MAFLVCLPIAGAIATFFDKKIEEGIPVAMFIATFVTYLCGLLGILTVSPFVVGAMAVASFGYCIWGIVREHSVRRFFTYGGIFFVILGVYYAFVSRGRMVAEQDDLQVYAKYVADFYHVGKVFRFDYIPGMMMWEYLSERFWRVFSDSVLFWAIAMLCSGMLLATFSEKEKKTKLYYVFVSLFVIILPLISKVREVYFVLQNDFVMGVTMAYITSMYLKARKYEGKFYEYAVYSGFAFLTLTKVTGFILACILILMIIGIDVIADAGKLSWKGVSFTVKCIASTVIAKYSWSIYVKVHGGVQKFANYSFYLRDLVLNHRYLIPIGIVAVLSLVLLLKWLVVNKRVYTYAMLLCLGALSVFIGTYVIMPVEIRNEAVKNFANVLFSTHAPYRDFGFGYRFYVPYAILIITLMFIWGVMIINDKCYLINDRDKNVVLFCNAGLIMFLAFLFLSNYLTRDPGQAARAKECERYVYAYIVYYLITYVFQFRLWEKIDEKIYKCVIAFILAIILIIANSTGIITQVKAQDDFYNFDGLNYIDINNDDVFFYIDQEGELNYSRFNYCISPATMINYYFSDMKVDGYWLGNNEDERYLAVNEWKDILKECTYVYVAATNEEFESMYGEFFEDEIIDGHIYVVNKDNDRVILNSIEY